MMGKTVCRSIYRLNNKPDERIILRYLSERFYCKLVASADTNNTIIEGSSGNLRRLRDRFQDIIMHGTLQAALTLAIPHRDSSGMFAEPRTVAAGFWRSYSDTVCERLTNGDRPATIDPSKTTYEQAGKRAGLEVELFPV